VYVCMYVRMCVCVCARARALICNEKGMKSHLVGFCINQIGIEIENVSVI